MLDFEIINKAFSIFVDLIVSIGDIIKNTLWSKYFLIIKGNLSYKPFSIDIEFFVIVIKDIKKESRLQILPKDL